jgi:ribose 1,5-bisphosphokinase PhnN
MKTLDLGVQRLTIDELLQAAETEVVLVRSEDGNEFLLEAADGFERKVADLASSEKFLSFLAERLKERGGVSIDEIAQRLSRMAE